MDRQAGDTYQSIREVALKLCAEHGYVHTSVAQIAEDAGISHMTFFRYFSTKQAVVTDGIFDCFDSLIASAVVRQNPSRPPLVRAIGALIATLENASTTAYIDSDEFRVRMRLIATSDVLLASLWRAGGQLLANLCRALRMQGTARASAHSVAGAAVGALLTILLDWARGSEVKKGSVTLRHGLVSLLADGVRPPHVSH